MGRRDTTASEVRSVLQAHRARLTGAKDGKATEKGQGDQAYQGKERKVCGRDLTHQKPKRRIDRYEKDGKW